MAEKRFGEDRVMILQPKATSSESELKLKSGSKRERVQVRVEYPFGTTDRGTGIIDGPLPFPSSLKACACDD